MNTCTRVAHYFERKAPASLDVDGNSVAVISDVKSGFSSQPAAVLSKPFFAGYQNVIVAKNYYY